MTEPHWLDQKDIVTIHGEILAESGGVLGILNENALDSTLNKPKNLYHYTERTATLYQLAAAYGYGLIKNHCFVDGNKRIALIAPLFLGTRRQSSKPRHRKAKPRGLVTNS